VVLLCKIIYLFIINSKSGELKFDINFLEIPSIVTNTDVAPEPLYQSSTLGSIVIQPADPMPSLNGNVVDEIDMYGKIFDNSYNRKESCSDLSTTDLLNEDDIFSKDRYCYVVKFELFNLQKELVLGSNQVSTRQTNRKKSAYPTQLKSAQTPVGSTSSSIILSTQSTISQTILYPPALKFFFFLFEFFFFNLF
jgi:hypothetical protein